jgi:hypothetical protein
MSATHERLHAEAIKAADRLHSDTSVSLHETWHSLVDLRNHVEMLMDAITNSMPKDEDQE